MRRGSVIDGTSSIILANMRDGGLSWHFPQCWWNKWLPEPAGPTWLGTSGLDLPISGPHAAKPKITSERRIPAQHDRRMVAVMAADHSDSDDRAQAQASPDDPPIVYKFSSGEIT